MVLRILLIVTPNIGEGEPNLIEASHQRKVGF